MPKKIIIGDHGMERAVGYGEPVYVIAEGGLTNWGRLNLAKKQVDAAMAAGCDAIKFQAQTTEALVSKKVDPQWYRRLKYKELSHDNLRELWEYCQIRNIQCFITGHTDIDLDFLDKELNVPFFKIGSGESLNYEFLRNVGSRGKPVIMSLGLHLSDEEALKSIYTLEEAGCHDIIIMHCNTVYPTPPEINHLSAINNLRRIIDYPVGYSDHTCGRHIVMAAIGMGACVIEKHLSLDRSDKRSLDCPGSLEPDEFKAFVSEIRELELAIAPPKKEREENIHMARKWANQSTIAARDIPQNTIITKEMVVFKRPGTGIHQAEFKDKLLGKTTKHLIEEDSLILEEDVM
jgi:N,N'-diacetyllegionaminate synthase